MFILDTVPKIGTDIFRSAFIGIDKAVYTLLKWAFQLFFSIADAELIDSSIIINIYNRIFMIIGVFMIFKLIVSFIKYAVNPDLLTDKSSGMGKLVTRIIVAILLLVVLMPMENYKNTDEYKESINETTTTDETTTTAEETSVYEKNGLLFGMLSKIEDVVIKNGTLSKLILGNSNYGIGKANNNTELKKVGENVSTTIFAAFFTVNQKCVGANQVKLNSLDDMFDNVNTTCTNSKTDDADYSKNETVYAFNYNMFISTIVGLGAAIIVFMFSFDIAIRAIQLAILRMISPIPAISYIDPKGAKGGALESYVKTLTSTYLSLFVRLAIIYLVIFLISGVTNTISNVATELQGFAKVVIILALLIFAKQAPKFFKDALGIKTDFGGSSGFKGLATLAGAGLGLIGGGIGGYAASRAGGASVFRSAVKGLTGATTGVFRGGSKALMNTKDSIGGMVEGITSANKAISEKNAKIAANAGTNGIRRLYETTRKGLTGSTTAESFDAKEKTIQSVIDDRKALYDYVVGKLEQGKGGELGQEVVKSQTNLNKMIDTFNRGGTYGGHLVTAEELAAKKAEANSAKLKWQTGGRTDADKKAFDIAEAEATKMQHAFESNQEIGGKSYTEQEIYDAKQAYTSLLDKNASQYVKENSTTDGFIARKVYDMNTKINKDSGLYKDMETEITEKDKNGKNVAVDHIRNEKGDLEITADNALNSELKNGLFSQQRAVTIGKPGSHQEERYRSAQRYRDISKKS